MTNDLEELYKKALDRNPSYAKAFLTTWMKGGMSTQQFENMLNQILEAKG